MPWEAAAIIAWRPLGVEPWARGLLWRNEGKERLHSLMGSICSMQVSCRRRKRPARRIDSRGRRCTRRIQLLPGVGFGWEGSNFQGARHRDTLPRSDEAGGWASPPSISTRLTSVSLLACSTPPACVPRTSPSTTTMPGVTRPSSRRSARPPAAPREETRGRRSGHGGWGHGDTSPWPRAGTGARGSPGRWLPGRSLLPPFSLPL